MPTTNSNQSRVVHYPTFQGRGYTNENSLAQALLLNPDKIDPVLTFLMGQESKKFPLSFLTEGQKGKGDMRGSIGLNDINFVYDVINQLDRPDAVVSSGYTSGDKPGLGATDFYVTFKTNWLKVGHTVEGPSEKPCFVVERPVPDGINFRYRLQMFTRDPADYIPLSDLVPGSEWSMVGGANVAQSFSVGNESNVALPGKMKGQLGILRKSYVFAGNISHKTVECTFMINGKPTRAWMAFEQWQHMLRWKEAVEENLWYSQYNRLPDGTILNKELISGQPIPRAAGLLDQVPNWDTYSFFTEKKLKNTVRDVLFGASDTGNMDIDMFTGTGGFESFDEAMKDKASGFQQVAGDKFIKGEGRNLMLTGFFTKYQHIDGHTVTVRHLPLLDLGGRAKKARRHPISGLPITSYDMYFIDRSIYDGKRNLVMYHEKGRSMITGILRGMSATPDDFNGNSLNINLATDQDVSSSHWMCTKAVLLRRNTHCFGLTCDLS